MNFASDLAPAVEITVSCFAPIRSSNVGHGKLLLVLMP